MTDNDYGDECVIKLANGNEIRTDAFPEDVSYVRVVENGKEIGYWTVDEVAEDPALVLGAILGAAHGATRASESAERYAEESLEVWCKANGVRVVQATEPEVLGMWDWLDESGNACDQSFPTKLDAMQNAYDVFNS